MRYLGGKARIASDVAGYLNLIRQPGQPYWEPFVGGGWILARIQGTPNWASDKHRALIAMWTALQGGWRPPTEVSEEEYRAARELPDTDPLKAFVGFGCSFSGKYWGGYARGDGNNYATHAHNSLMDKLTRMFPASFFPADFLTTDPPAPGCLIYCDPPYQGTTGYAVGDFDHGAFWRRCQSLEADGHTVVVSEYQAPAGFSVVMEIPTHTDIRDASGEVSARIERLFRPGAHPRLQPALPLFTMND